MSFLDEIGLKEPLERFVLAKAHLLQSRNRKWLDFRGAPHGSKGIGRFLQTPVIKAQCAVLVVGMTLDGTSFLGDPQIMLLAHTAASILLVPVAHQLFWKNFDRNNPVPNDLGIDLSGGTTESTLPTKKLSKHFYENAMIAIESGCGGSIPLLYAAISNNVTHPFNQPAHAPPFSVTALCAITEAVLANMLFNAGWCGLAGWMLKHHKWTINGPVAETEKKPIMVGARPAFSGQRFSTQEGALPIAQP